MMKSHTFIAFGLPFPGTHLLLCDTVPLIVLLEAQRNDTRHVGGYQEYGVALPAKEAVKWFETCILPFLGSSSLYSQTMLAISVLAQYSNKGA